MMYADFSSLYQKHWYTKNAILFISKLQKQLLFLQTAVYASVPTPSQASFWQICLYALIHAVPPSPLPPNTRADLQHFTRQDFKTLQVTALVTPILCGTTCTASRGHACYALSLYMLQGRAYSQGKDTAVFSPSSTEPVILTNQAISVCKGKPVIQ